LGQMMGNELRQSALSGRRPSPSAYGTFTGRNPKLKSGQVF
jgi:hypothetical protein